MPFNVIFIVLGFLSFILILIGIIIVHFIVLSKKTKLILEAKDFSYFEKIDLKSYQTNDGITEIKGTKKLPFWQPYKITTHIKLDTN